jgi:hypothetical protein
MRNRHRSNGTPIRGLLAGALVLSVATVLAGEAFAPAITPPEKMQDRDMWVGMIKQWKIPDKEAVAVPAYPGAYVVACMGASTMEANGEKSATLPALTLATEDDQAKVTAFYKKELADWSYKNSYDMFDIFWTGPEEFNNMDITQSAVTPNVTILAANAGQTDFMPTAKTAIIIVYKPVE